MNQINIFKRWYAKTVLWFLRSNTLSHRFISNSIANSYDEGYKAGLLQFSKEKLGKKYVKKVKKVINNAYKRENLNSNG
ncbi:MAG: hypothetical protein Tp1124DCM412261_22 [Prokaryotic dsDNA virus sp.]|nr:MAG: hypothetical protein Tp1124DCM412261_22 [Prokaryotic dsDNA virus sp.]|tara:strand:+ start:2969 stop:3205 length:237 start_codon:yes stop_codon:yes gene_type:complete